jgi:hypothetical protein
MDQLKDFMKQAVKYRFWIALGLSALLPLIGYFVGSGPIKLKADEETKKIEASAKKVVAYTQPGIPNHQYPPVIKEKTEVVSKDVTKAWEKLYAVQAPLLKWPDIVQERFQTWGKKWPEDVDRGAVQQALSDYALVYDKAVDATYAQVNPWEPMAGTGVVVVPDKTMLLHPAVFDAANPPELGKVWAAQERLWIQGTLLSAVAKINGAAKTWDSAIVKQIVELDVGSPSALDQKSSVQGKTVEPSPSLTPGGAEAAPAPEASNNPMEAMMRGMGSGAAAANDTEVYHITTESQQYTIMPVKMVAMVDQNRLEEYLIGLENSPMAIQVMEVELVKPLVAVTKPIKGEMTGGGMMGMMGMMGSGSGGMSGYPMGGSSGAAGYPGGGGMPGYPMGGSSGAAGYPGAGGMSGYPGGMMGMGGGTTKTKTGIDARSKDPKKEREAKEKARRDRARAVDMYYDIVEVTIYGQARFYNPPPAAPAAEPSTSAEAETAAEAGKPAAAPGTPAPITDPGKPAPVTDPGKPAPITDPGKPAAITDPGAPPKPGETPKPATPAEPAKTETAKPPVAPAAPTPAKPADAAPKSTVPAKPAEAPKPAGA